jgi:exopolysaccharide biosynthesis polyprenyl glycosylphosphotransferase
MKRHRVTTTSQGLLGHLRQPNDALREEHMAGHPASADEAAGPTSAQPRGRRSVLVRRVLAGADVVALVAALAVAILAAHATPQPLLRFALLIATLPIWLVLFKLYGLYDRDARGVNHSTVDDAPRVFHALLVGGLGLWGYAKLTLPYPMRLIEALVFFGSALVGCLAMRALARYLIAARIPPERVLFIGHGPMTGRLMSKIHVHPEYGMRPVGYLADAEDANDAEDGDLPRLGGFADLEVVCTSLLIERVIVVATEAAEEEIADLVRRTTMLDIAVSAVPQLVDVLGPSVEVDDIEGVTVLGINPPALTRPSRFLKRSMDFAIAGVALLVLLPAMLAAALAVALTSRGPVFYTQVRVGRDGRRFRMYKFRTMVEGADSRVEELRADSADPAWLLLERDPRITGVGRFLRTTSIDELPQLVNVLKGEMSLVGPRPVTPEVDGHIDGWARRRVDMAPGLTGLWQVLGRARIPFEEMVKLDYLYVTNWSLWQDLRLLVGTLPAVIKRRGVN